MLHKSTKDESADLNSFAKNIAVDDEEANHADSISETFNIKEMMDRKKQQHR